MALTIEQQPSIHTGAFGRNVIRVSTDSGEVKRIKYELVYDSNVIATQFSPIFAYLGEITLGDPQGIFNISGLYSSFLPYYNNPIKGLTANFTQIDAVHHQKLITDKIDEVGADGTTSLNRRIYKAVDTKYGISTFWNAGGTQRFLAYNRSKDNKVVRHAFQGQHIPIAYYNANTTTGLYIQITNADGTSNLGLTNINQFYRVANWKVNTVHEYNVISVGNSQVNLELIVDNNKYKRTKTLYFLNRFGGWEWYNFLDYDKVIRSNKSQYTKYINHQGDTDIQQIINGVVDEYKLYGRPLNGDYLYYLEDLITSPIVLDEQGERVRVLNNNIDVDGDDIFEPEITIQYIKEDTITY